MPSKWPTKKFSGGRERRSGNSDGMALADVITLTKKIIILIIVVSPNLSRNVDGLG